MSFLLPALTLWERELRRFRRQHSRVIGAFGTPIVFWLLLGSGIGTSFRSSGTGQSMNYLEYFYPGTMLLVVLFTSIFSTFSVIEDRKEGFLQAVLVAPVSRLAIVFGKVLGGTTLAVLQGVILLFLAPLLGVRISFSKALVVALGLLLLSLWLTAAGFAIAWRISSSSGFHGIMNLLLMPMWMLSGALFPMEGAAGWLQWVMRANPLTYALILLREPLYWGTAAPAGPFAQSWEVSLIVNLVCCVVATVAAVRAMEPVRGVAAA